MDYRELSADEINVERFARFIRRQVVTKCWRNVDGEWRILDVPFVDDWGAEEMAELARCLRKTALDGGLVYAALDGDGFVKGMTSVQPTLYGANAEYLDLSSIHVSQDMRGQGVGRALFAKAKAWAKAHGARKLYISAHSAVESQAFYRAMGCVDAVWIDRAHAEEEPCDRQLECALD